MLYEGGPDNRMSIDLLNKCLLMKHNYNLLCLNEIRKNLAADLERSPLIHSYCYESAGDRPTSFAQFPLNFVPFTQYAARTKS